MLRRLRRVAPHALALLLVLGSSSAGAQTNATAAGASARAQAIKIVWPAGEAGTAEIIAPPDAVQFAGGFAYPDDASILVAGPVTASASASTTESSADSSASSEIGAVSLFGGEITIETVIARATASGRPGEATGSTAGSGVTGLVVAGTPVDATSAGQVPLGDWGYADVLVEGAAPASGEYRGFVTSLDVHVTADHGGLPAGSEILIGYAEAAATAAELPPSPPPTVPTTPLEPSSPPVSPKRNANAPKAASPRPGPAIPPIVRRPLPSLTPRLTKRGYVFPVHGPSSFVDTFGAGRAVVGWHHGEDIFALIGAPVLAVAKGTVFSVGWNDLGGNRLWLRDEQGNEFYYAHLAAFSPLAVDGAHVRAGDVLGFVGNSGDAETTPPHLHFEIHPVGLLALGYDGVVNPYPYLLAWQRLEDVRFVAGASWTPSLAQASDAPTPGAFLLSSTDIASASGLDRRALRQVLDQQPSAESPSAARAN
jgi:murein DD-endopeptidase MepM/ murein hydrolase activator NlpD